MKLLSEGETPNKHRLTLPLVAVRTLDAVNTSLLAVKTSRSVDAVKLQKRREDVARAPINKKATGTAETGAVQQPGTVKFFFSSPVGPRSSCSASA